MFLVTYDDDDTEKLECTDWEHVCAQIKHLVEALDVRPADIRVWCRQEIEIAIERTAKVNSITKAVL